MRKSALLFLCLVFQFPVLAQNWADMQQKTLEFYRYQRAGIKGANCYNPYYTMGSNFPHESDNYNGTDLSGGWYDAGDFIKFGLPFASTAYLLLKGYDVFPDGYSDVNSYDKIGTSDKIPDVLNEVKTATDFMMKAIINNSTVIYDVGTGGEHQSCGLDCGGACCSAKGNRPASVANGADVPGLYAATLALMSSLYRQYDAPYADKCLEKAKMAYTAGWGKKRMSSVMSGGFYDPSGEGKAAVYQDKMMAGAIELYKVTKTQLYFDNLKEMSTANITSYNPAGWVSVGPVVSFELWRQGLGDGALLLSHVGWTKSLVLTTPASMKGAFFNTHWGMAGDNGDVAFTAGLAYVLTGDESYRTFAETTLKWVSGHAGGRSYIVGYNNGPTAVHHRNAISSGKLPTGALVSGPNNDGTFNAGTGDYEYTEVAIDYNAGIPGGIAFIRDITNTNSTKVKISKALTATPNSVDFNTKTVAFAATFEKTTAWKLLITGQTSGATKLFTGSGTALTATWGGEADSGSFIATEMVTCKLDMPEIAIYHISRAMTGVTIAALKKEPFKATDILVDDFDDGNMTNAVGGSWSFFTDGKNSTTYPVALPEANTAVGETGKGLNVRFFPKAGVTHPYAGIRTTFDAKGGAVKVGAIKSIVFDVKAAIADQSFYVELEQQDIADSAYYAVLVKLPNTVWNRVRLPLSAFVAPAVKPKGPALNLDKIVSVRFVKYDSLTANVTIDNLRIEDLKVSSSSANLIEKTASRRPFVAVNKMHTVLISQDIIKNRVQRIEVLTMKGTIVATPAMTTVGNDWYQINLAGIADGVYMIRGVAANRETFSTPIVLTR